MLSQNGTFQKEHSHFVYCVQGPEPARYQMSSATQKE